VRPGGAPIPEELFAVPQIEVDDRTYRELELLAVAWHTTITEAVDRLVLKGATRAPVRAHPAGNPVEIYAFYNGTRTDATFDPESHTVTVCSGPLRGHTYASPTDAEDAVCDVLNPDNEGVVEGWTSWLITASRIPLDRLTGDRNGLHT
jgi:hypothetical protein